MSIFTRALTFLSMLGLAVADEPVQVNFNLVQVNQYPGQSELTGGLVTPGKRLVIDVSEPSSALNYIAATSSIPIRMRSDWEYADNPAVSGSALEWETSRIFYAPARRDSFLVAASRTGCPGTEVAPSVSVAFSNGVRWSDPPIRFGPLTEYTVCPLGNGYQLEVNGRGMLSPLIRVIQDRSLFGRR